MTDLNKQELRRLAHEASETEMGWLDRDWLASIMADDWADYVAALNPSDVIALLDENSRLSARTSELVTQCNQIWDRAKAAEEDSRNLRVQLERQTELRRREWNRAEALKVDAARYRWTSSGVQEAETLLSVVLCHGGDSGKIAGRIDIYMEANKEASHE